MKCFIVSMFIVMTISESYSVSNTIEKKTLLTEKDKRGTTQHKSSFQENESSAETRRRGFWNRGSSDRYYADGRPGPPYPEYDPGLANGHGGYIPSGPSGYGHSGNYDGLYGGNLYRPSSYGSSYGSHYGPSYGPSSEGGYIEPHHSYIPEHEGHQGGGIQKALALKKILIPLAGLAILGAAAVASTNPVLLQLGVVNGRKRRSIVPEDKYSANPILKSRKIN
ncbi:uncharacterized protein LOC115883244 [Sitophilus oryzae]|uniref:Uncharacterized protein LOC115883244 n=1 Tax=Sitophilus oryzae TaxID=7048 RepID=A0A6J2Y363_SITOR|nr:uncharacterized protein LOC115883244 [Sitophilus oryzae]